MPNAEFLLRSDAERSNAHREQAHSLENGPRIDAEFRRTTSDRCGRQQNDPNSFDAERDKGHKNPTQSKEPSVPFARCCRKTSEPRGRYSEPDFKSTITDKSASSLRRFIIKFKAPH